MEAAENQNERPLVAGRVSIIIPVYNREATLKRCLDSALSQTWENIEIIPVDDASTDASREILLDYARMDTRVKPIFKEHAGVSDSRNRGMAAATGEFLQFLDADDWIVENSTETFVNAITEGNCEMAISDYYRVVGQKVFEKTADMEESGVYSREEFAEKMMTAPANFYYGVMWNKFFRTELVRRYGLQCNLELDWCEDFQFNLEYLCQVHRIAVIKQPLYYYVKTKGSLVNTQTSPRKVYQTKMLLMEYYKDLYKSYDLYENHRLRIQMYLVSVAHDRGKLFPVEELPEELVRSELGEDEEKGWKLVKSRLQAQMTQKEGRTAGDRIGME